jgi:hypothetical protein
MKKVEFQRVRGESAVIGELGGTLARVTRVRGQGGG